MEEEFATIVESLSIEQQEELKRNILDLLNAPEFASKKSKVIYKVA